MKLIFNIVMVLALAPGVAGAAADDLQKLAAMVDYVAADYPFAVKGGQVASPTEYEEQRGMVADAGRRARALPEGAAQRALVDDIGRLARAVDAKAPPEEVTRAARAARARLVNELGLVLVPAAPPSPERARALFTQSCASCHGEDGRADTEQARKLKPPPVSFRDPTRMSCISPTLAFHALTFGVPDTGMAAFDTLPAADRWSLAFHVIALRHDAAPPNGAALFAQARPPVSPTPSRLAGLTDAELDALLAPSLPKPEERAAVLAWLRREAPYAAAPGGTFAEARRLLSAIVPSEAAQRHDLAVASYLDGVEPHEAALKARDPDLANRIELGFLDLRKAIDEGAPADALARRVGGLQMLLDRAEEHRSSPSVAFLAALTIALREGLEAALLIAALLAFLRKGGHMEAARLVHLGWLAAVPAGLATWFLAGALVAGARRELVEAVVALLAAAMILLVSHWVLGRHEAKQWVGFLQRRVMAMAPGQSGWPLFALSFVAAYREAFEVVLFYRALLLDVGPERGAVAAGAAAGVVAIAIVVLTVARLGRRLNPRPVMLASSVLLAALSIALVGRGVRALQEGGFIALSPVRMPDLSVVGIYPTLQGLLAQLVTLAAIFAPSIVERLRRRAAPAPAKEQRAES
jgi:high-affinity iron transporter